MRFKPDDDADDGDFDKYDEVDDNDLELSLLTGEMMDDLARYLGDRWRSEEENKVISVNLSLATALDRTPTKWLDAACRVNHIPIQGRGRWNRQSKIAALVARLTSREELRRCVMDLPAHARTALRRVIDSGGWMRLSELTRDFGPMDGDGWFWDEDPPTSSLGELRRRGLLFVGRTPTTKDGKTGKRMSKVAVVPSDIRELVKSILAETAIRAEDESALLMRLASPEELLGDAIFAAGALYADLELDPPLTLADVEGFLHDIGRGGCNPLSAWSNLEILLNFLQAYMHEIHSLDDLCGYHVSELASSFLDISYPQRHTLRDRRNLIRCVHRLYRYLHAHRRITDETYEEVRTACTRLMSGRRKLNLIRRPPPLGGELIFTRVNPNTGEEERYTFNHQRLLMVWAGAFHQDWKTMLSVCEMVPSGKQKAALTYELIALDPGICDLILSQQDEDDFDRAIIWFYEERLLELSAW